MKSLIYCILFFSLISNSNLFAQSNIDCIACVDTTHRLESFVKNEMRLCTDKSKQLIYHFLLCFDLKCTKAAELLEYSNEVIYKLLEIHPKLLLEVMSKNKKQIPWKNICDEIAHPINDIYKINEIIKGINDISGYSNVKKDILDALCTAKDKM